MTREEDHASGGAQPAIGDYAAIGDCRTMALVSKGGSIDWLCLPRLDGPSVFAAVLDGERGGRFRVRPVNAHATERRYLPGTNVLETTFRTDRGVVRLTDLMTVHRPKADRERLHPDHEVMRRLECLAGEVEIEVLCDPRFDWGRRVPRGKRLGRLGIHFDGGANDLMLASDIPLAPRSPEPGWEGAVKLRRGDRRHLSLTAGWAAPTVMAPTGDPADRRVEDTVGWWRDWLSHSSYEGEYADQVRRSLLALKLLTYPASGAILAAGTTSLPEVLGGSRNWDYRFCWLRDASMTMEVLLHLGFAPEGEAFLGWLLQVTPPSFPDLSVLYDVYGRTGRGEEALDHLAGYRGSRPVRVGNAASGQLQLDIYGEVIAAAWTFVEQGGALDPAEARLVAALGDRVLRSWRLPGNGTWEVRGERRHYTLSKVMCWTALDRLLRLGDAGVVRLPRPRAEIEHERKAIRDAVESDGWHDGVGSYVAWFGGEEVDAALLLLGIVGFEDPAGDRMHATMSRVRNRLGTDGLLRRYRYDDGQPGREGAFGICGFWEAELLARQGRIDDAVRRFEHAASFANDVGLFSEEIDPESGALLGNFPQAFTHLGLASAANQIARARGRHPARRARRPQSTRARAET